MGPVEVPEASCYSNPGVELPRVTWGGARMGSSSCDSSNVSVPTGSMSSRRGDGRAP